MDHEHRRGDRVRYHADGKRLRFPTKVPPLDRFGVRYVLTVRTDASSKTLYPSSVRVEQYRCLQTPTVGAGTTIFRVPENGPGVDLDLSSASSPVHPVVHLEAGRSRTFRAAEPEVEWVACAHGDHVVTSAAVGPKLPRSGSR